MGVLRMFFLIAALVSNLVKMQTDCVFTTIPFTDTVQPLLAPAILKSIALSAGCTAATIDLNGSFLRYLDTVEDQDRRFRLTAFFQEGVCYPEVLPEIYSILEGMCDRILALRPRVVGISVFTYNCQTGTKYLAWMLKRRDSNIRILIGGPGVLHHFSGPSKWAKDLKKYGLIDEFVTGDGEKVLYDYLKAKQEISGLSTDHWDQLSNQEISSMPYPDYDDYDFSLYDQPVKLALCGSRGCVRKCAFCDVHEHWKKFTWRGGEQIYNEMVYLSQRHDVTNFHFTDSLINGNLKEYRILMSLLAEYNRDRDEEHKLKWYSYFIFRPKASFSEEDWRLTAEGGGRGLSVGIETLSDTARAHLGKHFTNEDIEWSFQMAQKYGGIRFILLFFTGYITETDKDHEFALQWWPKQVKYRDVIAKVNPGSPLGILHNTPLDLDFDRLGLKRVGENPEDWCNPATDNTPEKRLRWNREIRQAVIDCGFKLTEGRDVHYILERMKATTR